MFVRRYVHEWSGIFFVVLLSICSTPLYDVEWSGTYIRTQVRTRVEWDHALSRIFLPKKFSRSICDSFAQFLQNFDGSQENWLCCLMMNRRMVFGDIVTVVGFSQCPVKAKSTLAFPASEPMVFHVHCFQFFITLLLTTLRAVVSLVCIGVGGCVRPKYSSV